jgi:hypothetical protein
MRPGMLWDHWCGDAANQYPRSMAINEIGQIASPATTPGL